MSSSIGRIFHTVAKNVDVQDVTKAANSRQVREVAGDAFSNIGEALANSSGRNGADVASTLIEEGADAVSTSAPKKGFWGWLKGLFKNSSSDDIPDISTKNLCNEITEQTTDELEDNVQTLSKQIDTSKTKSTKKTKSDPFELSDEQKEKLKETSQEVITNYKNGIKEGWEAIKRETKQDIEWIKEKTENIKSWASLMFKSFKGEAVWSSENKCFITR